MPVKAAATVTLLCTVFVASPAQTAQASDVKFSNPPAIAKPMGYTHVVDVGSSQRMVFIAGQIGIDRDGKLADGFRAQARQGFENIRAALASVGAGFENIVKLNMYLTDIETQLSTLREVRDSYINTAAPPASTTVEITKLAVPGALFEVEAIVVVPPNGQPNKE